MIDREGDLGTALHVIRTGGVDVYQGYGTDHQQHLATFGEGDFFGEMALLLGPPAQRHGGRQHADRVHGDSALKRSKTKRR